MGSKDETPADDSASPALQSAPLEEVLDVFVKRLNAIYDTFRLVHEFTGIFHNELQKDFEGLRDAYGSIIREQDSIQTIEFPIKYRSLANNVSERIGHLRTALEDFLPKNFVISLVSQYDAFLGQLLTALFQLRPETLDESEKKLSYGELISFESLAHARNFLVEKEVEAVLRDSHSKQFEWMERKFSLKLREGLEAWPHFIELTERRNLFTHTDGTVSTQYLSACKAAGVQGLDELQPGTKLGADAKYFRESYSILLEIGIKLAHVFWRKMAPGQRERADSHLNYVAYEFLRRGRNRLAAHLLDFATETLKKHHSERIRRMMVVNRAQAYKFSNRKEQAIAILDKEDWSVTGDEFTICTAIIRDDVEAAINAMKRLGTSDRVGKEGYIDWPVFKEFRKLNAFKETYREIFGEEFEIATTFERKAVESPQSSTGSADDLAVTESASPDNKASA